MMKYSILIISAVLDLFVNAFPQLTFEKIYGKGEGEYVEETSDGGYLIKSHNASSNSNTIIRANNRGETIWTKTVSSEQNQKIIEMSNNTFVHLKSFKSNAMLMIMLDMGGKELWQKSLDLSDVFFFDAVNIGDGIIIAGCKNALKRDLVLCKIDYEGNVAWKKTASLQTSIKLHVKEVTNNIFMIFSGNFIYEIDNNGMNEKYIPLEREAFAFAPVSNGFVFTGNKIMWQIDEDGNTIWSRDVQQSYKSIYSLSDDDFLATGSSVDEINSQGEIIRTRNFNSMPAFITKTRDNGFILTGKIDISISEIRVWVIKTNENLDFRALSVIEPYSFEKDLSGNPEVFFYYNSNIELRWRSNNITNLNIYFSADSGKTWSDVAEKVSADSLNYKWEIPFVNSYNCLIKISEYDNPDNYTISDPFKIFINRKYDYIAINELKMWLINNGIGSYNPDTYSSGLFWPGGENAVLSAVFTDGLVWGGKVDNAINVNGSVFRSGLKPGIILSENRPADPDSSVYNIWRLRKDWQNLPEGTIKNINQYNYENWPGDIGAPYIDTDGDGRFTRGIDQPKISGDETLWFASNDLDSITSQYAYGCNPEGLEFQVTTFGFNTILELKDVIFKKYKIINKGINTIEDMYLSYFSDPDLGYGEDDFIGCDTLLNLAYFYNEDNNDNDYYGANPPAAGYKLLQGPVIPGTNEDSAFYNGHWNIALHNLPMSSFILYNNADPVYIVPTLGTYEGALQMYNNMHGLLWNGNPFINPITNQPTKYFLSGDPVSKNGWYEGEGWPHGLPGANRLLLMNSGPFNFAPGDTQEIVIAFIIARGNNNINSIAELKKKAQIVQSFYNSDYTTGIHQPKSFPVKFELFQNYPNPFNPVTTILYSIPPCSPFNKEPVPPEREGTQGAIPPFSKEPVPLLREGTQGGLRGLVTLKVYDILGKEVATLVNEEKAPGKYSIQFNASLISSGVYFYTLRAGNNISTKKLIILK